MSKRVIKLEEYTIEGYTKKAMELAVNGFKFDNGRKLGYFYFGTFTKEEADVVTEAGTAPKIEEVVHVTPQGETIEVSSSKGEPDFEHAATLSDKDELEDYARLFDVELSKRKSLKNMLKEFKDLHNEKLAG